MVGKSDKNDQIALILESLKLPPGLNIREWSEEDFPAIQVLSSAEGWTTPQNRSLEAFKGWQNSWPVLVAEEDDTIIGFLRAISDGEITTYVAEILVDPVWRGRGLGMLLLEVCHRLVPNTRFDLLSMEQAVNFYQNHGFREFRGFRKSDFTV